MTAKKKIKLIHEGRFAAEVEADLIDDETGWAPYLSVADARKLDAVRFALKAGGSQTLRRLHVFLSCSLCRSGKAHSNAMQRNRDELSRLGSLNVARC